MNAYLKTIDVDNTYFPIFVTKEALEKEQNHVEGFSAEVAWVTKSGQSELQNPIALRPTSETIMYPAFSTWIRSHRDLPLKVNQWSNVVRWEFKHPVPFIRTREFLWQEGHTAHANKQDAEDEVQDILDLYARTYEELLAVPVIKGLKTEEEKFAGGDYTTTVEAFIAENGRGIQAATSHHLGQNFSKMFDITYSKDTEESIEKKTKQKNKGEEEKEEKKEEDKNYVYQNSWGFTTRSIGAMIMVHGDDDGLVLPPRVAKTQVVIIPIYKKNLDNEILNKKVKEIMERLKKVGIRVKCDLSMERPGRKYNYYELRGIPFRMELGPNDLKKNQVFCCRRDTKKKMGISLGENFEKDVQDMLETIQKDLLKVAREKYNNSIVRLSDWDKFIDALEDKKVCLVPSCLEKECECKVTDRSNEEFVKRKSIVTAGAKSLCIPFDTKLQTKLPDNCKCFNCGKAAKKWVLFGRSY